MLAGPVEATALGNVLVQARALGADLPDLAAMRALVRRTHDVRRFEPRTGLDWAAAEERLPSSGLQNRCTAPIERRWSHRMKRQLPKRRDLAPLLKFKRPTLSPKQRRLEPR